MTNDTQPIEWIKPQIRQQMRLGNTEQVIALLHESGIPEAVDLTGRMAAAQQQYKLGLIDAETWSRTQLQFYHAVMDLAFVQDVSVPNISSVSDKSQLRLLVEGHEIRKALAFCEAFGDASILIQAQYEIGRKQYEAGVIELANWELIQHKTKYLLWELAEKMAVVNATEKSVWKRILGWFG